MLRLGGTRLHRALLVAYRALARAVAAYLPRGERGAAVYLTGSFADGEPVPGVSDIDLAIVVRDDPRASGEPRERVKGRWQALRRRLRALNMVLHVTVTTTPGCARRRAARRSSMAWTATAPSVLARPTSGRP